VRRHIEINTAGGRIGMVAAQVAEPAAQRRGDTDIG
jgi:hypothetical protein